MGRTLALLIGVRHVDGLPQLSRVGSELNSFEEWVVSQGFESIRFDDLAKGRQVSLSEIRDAVEKNIHSGDVEKLFVYFTGHGIIRGLGDEYWLLSQAAKYDDEAVNVFKSVQMCFNKGFRHVAFFGDACRTAASQDFIHVNGGSLFPQEDIYTQGVQVDEFHAAQFGNPAYETPGEGFFSDCLIRALQGVEPAAVRDVEGGVQPRAVVSQSLRPVIEEKVRLAADKIGRDQRPFCRPGSEWQPNVLSWVAPRQPPPDQELGPGGTTSSATPRDAEVEAEFARRDAADLTELTSEYLAADGIRFRTRQEPVVMGARVTRIVGRRPARSRIRDWTRPTLGGLADEAGSRMLRFGLRSPARWAGVARLPGYSCTVIFRPDASPGLAVDYVAYLPLNDEANVSQDSGIAALVADTSARVRLGRFGVEDLDESEYLRSAVFEQLNPTLTVLMAYILLRAGRQAQVHDMVSRFERSGLTLPFDLPLLADIPGSRVQTTIAPGFPLMTSGWALIDELPAGRAVLDAARQHLRPSMWTTLERPPAFVVKALAHEDRVGQRKLQGV